MTDELILKALGECPKNFMCCDCKYGGICDGFEELSSYALALIARLKTEKAELIEENRLFETSNDQLSADFFEIIRKGHRAEKKN